VTGPLDEHDSMTDPTDKTAGSSGSAVPRSRAWIEAKEPLVVRKTRKRLGVGPRTFVASGVALVASVVIIGISLALAPADQRDLLLAASLLAFGAGIALTSVGVYGGVLVPGLLLLGVDPRFAAPLSLFLQVLIVPFGAGAHYRLGNVKRSLVIPLVIGGVMGALLGPVVASFFEPDVIRLAVEVLIILAAILLLVSLPLKQMQVAREAGDVPTGRIGAIGAASGMASGISGAGWGPMGVTLLILSRIEPRFAVGSSVFGRIFMAAAAVLSAAVVMLLTPGLYDEIDPEWIIVLPLLAASVAAMLPGAVLATRLGRTRMSVLIGGISITLASLALLAGIL
jgi:uncharacterized membrane protein YfcA